MFEGFEEKKDEGARKRFMASTGSALAVFGVLGVAVAYVGARAVVRRPQEEAIDVSFHGALDEAEPEPEKKDEPPPPPPPPTAKKPASRPGRVLAEPTAMPEARPQEAAPTGEAAGEGNPDEFGDGASAEKRPPPPPPASPPPAPEPEVARPAPVDVPDEEAVPPRPLPGNAPPAYPEDARKKGLEAVVILRIRISASGDVTKVDVLRGEEPFLSTAVATVRSWRYSPALVEGQPAEVSRIVRIPFRLKS